MAAAGLVAAQSSAAAAPTAAAVSREAPQPQPSAACAGSWGGSALAAIPPCSPGAAAVAAAADAASSVAPSADGRRAPNRRRQKQREKRRGGRQASAHNRALQAAKAELGVDDEDEEADFEASALSGSAAALQAGMANKAAASVVNLVREQLAAAWDKLRKEFEVQLLIWQSEMKPDEEGRWTSVMNIRGSAQQSCALLVEVCLRNSDTDPIGATMPLELMLTQASKDGRSVLNSATSESTKAVLEAARLGRTRLALADLLTAVGHAQAAPLEQESEVAVESAMLKEDTTLLCSVRLALGLSPPPEEVAAAPSEEPSRGRAQQKGAQPSQGMNTLGAQAQTFEYKVKNTFLHFPELEPSDDEASERTSVKSGSRSSSAPSLRSYRSVSSASSLQVRPKRSMSRKGRAR